MGTKFLILQILFYCLAQANSFNLSYPAVFSFGDSNSDTGAQVAGFGIPLLPPYGQTFFGEPVGRYCDGRLIIDFLRDAAGMPFLKTCLDSVGAPNFRTGISFATSVATILPNSAYDYVMSPISFDYQVAQFIRFKGRVLDLLAEDSKYHKILPSEDDFKRGLYTFDIGQNDVEASFYTRTEEQVYAFIPTIVAGFKAGVERLYNEGARNFWIQNAGPLGCLSRLLLVYGGSGDFDELQCLRMQNNASRIFNSQLHDLVDEFQTKYPDTKVTYVDIYSIKSDLIANHTQYGFTDAYAACCGYGGPPYNFSTLIRCGQTGVLNGTTVTVGSCSNPAEHVNWDGTHYTEAANKFVAAKILSGKYSETYRSN